MPSIEFPTKRLERNRIVNLDFYASQLRQAVVNARARLKSVEETHERLLDSGASEVLTAGRDYAAAVQEYANAVMAWLVFLERRTDRTTDGSPASEKKSAKGAGEP